MCASIFLRKFQIPTIVHDKSIDCHCKIWMISGHTGKTKIVSDLGELLFRKTGLFECKSLQSSFMECPKNVQNAVGNTKLQERKTNTHFSLNADETLPSSRRQLERVWDNKRIYLAPSPAMTDAMEGKRDECSQTSNIELRYLRIIGRSTSKCSPNFFKVAADFYPWLSHLCTIILSRSCLSLFSSPPPWNPNPSIERWMLSASNVKYSWIEINLDRKILWDGKNRIKK